MNDRELEQQLRAWYRGQVPEAERAPMALRSGLASLTQAGPRVRSLPAREGGSAGLLRLVPIGLAAAAAIIALIVGLSFLGDRPSTVGGPSLAPDPSDAAASPTVVPSSATWRPTGSMATARWDHAAIALADGQVLVVGGLGVGEGSALASAELYDPDTGTWTVTGAMSTARHGHTLALLADGTILAAGGRRSADPEGAEVTSLDSAELYDPATGTWTATASMTTGRLFHTATVLDDGTVLVAGGHATSEYTASAEIYDPSARTWTRTTDMSTARASHAATLLGDGTVLVTGGSGTPAAQGSAEVYDPGAATWSRVGDNLTGRFEPTATLLADGRVLITGSMRSQGAIYDPGTRAWTQTQDASWGCSDSRAALLGDGNVLETCTGVSQVYDPTTDTWAPNAAMNQARYLYTLTPLADGRVLAAGGQAGTDQGGVQASAELYDPGR